MDNITTFLIGFTSGMIALILANISITLFLWILIIIFLIIIILYYAFGKE